MNGFVGIDLGSTTTKAVVLAENREVLGRGITNSRSNYDLAASVARSEALISARFGLLRREVEKAAGPEAVARLRRAFLLEQTLHQLHRLHELMHEEAMRSAPAHLRVALATAAGEICRRIASEEEARFSEPAPLRRSEFFRDLAGSAFNRIAEEIAEPSGITFDLLTGLFDKCIIKVENEPLDLGFRDHIGAALARVGSPEVLRAGVDAAASASLDETATVGTGYGRARLPSRRSRSARRSSATDSAPTRCSREPAPCSTSAARTPRRSRWTGRAS